MDCRREVVRLVAVALLLYALLGLAAQWRLLCRTESAERELSLELRQLREENAALAEKLSGASRDREMERLARERLGMVRPGDTVFYFVDGTD